MKKFLRGSILFLMRQGCVKAKVTSLHNHGSGSFPIGKSFFPNGITAVQSICVNEKKLKKSGYSAIKKPGCSIRALPPVPSNYLLFLSSNFLRMLFKIQ